MSELGNYLKENREEKQLSLDDLQQRTKIQKRYLVAIEEGNFDTLPGIFYARAFVKTYAEAVGLNAEEVLTTYKNELPSPQSESVDLPSRAERVKPPKQKAPAKSGNRSLGTILVPILIVIVLALIVYFVWTAGDSSNTDNTAEEPQEGSSYDGPTADEDEADNDEGDVTDEDEAQGDEKANSDTEDNGADPELVLENEDATTKTYTLTNADSFDSLLIEMNDEGTYVELRENEGSGTVEQNYPPFNEDFEPDVTDLESLYVRIGFGAEVDTFTVNGLEIDLLDTSSVQVIEVLLESENE
ncbi:transcriptional regulator in cluster with unspecified monosaccharide ABC transport system [Bacillus sp. JCM 19047]|nr:transcriptional regulator in cluster with unspecified monosaccharide ABC transport system [Bacillus sp. JCM 19047]